MGSWHVYVLVSASGGRTYVGITCDLDRRLAQHNGDRPGGAKATRPGRPWSVGATFGPYATRGRAQRIEHRIKRRSGRDRLRPLGPDEVDEVDEESVLRG
ncbi:GIY-YIG nuclease family protein [Paraliomyxa miuraensis]|uniref:GIY-YIG nuclease family protein n=1 Tax=Paraliomyxa miuraensis TaxID=376150 RepID=UPI00225ACF72|nr:GIY-YIG nuclease family protein [Paraliomyxa miuraensis]MCX4244927.1 GIY-YIG nuclease family protein [Paraliomyxa miuraensis]